MGVAVATSAAAGHDDLIGRLFEVAEQVTAVAVAHQGSWRDLDDQVLAAAAEAVGTLTMLAPLCPPVALVRQVSEVGMAFATRE